TERDASGWSSDKLKELLMGVRVEGVEGTCEVTEVSKLDGEASINNRKGKLIFFYEWDVKLNWTGTSPCGVKYKGYVEIPNLSDENDASEVEIRVSLAKDEPDTNLTALMRKEGARRIREAVAFYISALRTEFTQGMILPTANGVSHPGAPAPRQDVEPEMQRIKSVKCPSGGVKIPTCKVTLKETFLTSPEELYRVFTRQEVQSWARAHILYIYTSTYTPSTYTPISFVLYSIWCSEYDAINDAAKVCVCVCVCVCVYTLG
ncbi:hypothetical protein FKM82_018907, partial [Ascaphus truei]